VTVTIGGNDIDYLLAAIDCSQDYRKGGCHAAFNRSKLMPLVSALPGKLTATVEAIRAVAPHTMVVFVTYPRIVPVDPASCPALHLTPQDANTIAWLGQVLERDTTTVARQQHALLADAYAHADGHGPCATKGQAWVFGSKVPTDQSAGNFPFHPTNGGRSEMAGLVEAALVGK
jgi:hypothetical protein